MLQEVFLPLLGRVDIVLFLFLLLQEENMIQKKLKTLILYTFNVYFSKSYI